MSTATNKTSDNVATMRNARGKSPEDHAAFDELKGLYLKVQYLNSVLPILQQLRRMITLRGEERFEQKNISHNVYMYTTFDGDFNVEIHKNDGGQKVLWTLKGGNGLYEQLYLSKDLTAAVVNKHRVGCQIRNGAPPPGRKKPVYLAMNHWIHRLFLIHASLARVCHEADIDFITPPGEL